MVFDDSEKQKRNGRGQNIELGSAGNLGFGFPAEELYRKEEGNQRPASERNDFDVTAGRRGGVHDGLLQSVDKVGGGEKKSDALNGGVEIGKREGGAGKENKRQPQELIQDLCFLHGVGDAGDDQAKRTKGDGTNGD